MSHKSQARIIAGNWEWDTVQLDFDRVPLGLVKYWCFRTMYWFKLEGFKILESSRKELVARVKRGFTYSYAEYSYHAVFDKPVRWDTNVKIMDWVALESGIPQVQKYALMQGIKESSTLRMSCKGKKQPPRVIFRYGSQDRQIKKFLETKRLALSLMGEG